MLRRKSSKSMHKDEQMCHHQKHLLPNTAVAHELNLQSHKKKISIFNLPGLFVGLSPPMVLPDLDSASSPTSPLDFKVHPNASAANSVRSPRSPHAPLDGGHHKVVWGTDKVGLSIVDSLDDGVNSPRKLIGSFESSKNILFGPQLRIKAPPKLGSSFDSLDGKKTLFGPQQLKIRSPRFADPSLQTQPNSLPKNYAFPHTHFKSPLHKGSSSVVFEIGDSLNRDDDPLKEKESPLMQMSVGSSNGFVGSLSASDIELSEDYTCVTVHGPNPKTTHIYADCVLEGQFDDSTNFDHKKENCGGALLLPVVDEELEVDRAMYPSRDFLSLCDMCKKVLAVGKDIYIYRGEQAFCSLECRSKAILIDEEMEKSDGSTQSSLCEEGFEIDSVGTE